MIKNKIGKIFNSIKTFLSKPFRKVSHRINKSIAKKAGKDSILEALRSDEVKSRIYFTIGIIIVYRILAAVPLPGIDIKVYNEVFGGTSVNNLFTIITGGRLDNPSVVAIGLGGYINASIIIQLLTSVIPRFEELSKEGERGRRILNMYTRILALPLNILQGFVIYSILKSTAESIPQLSGLVANITTFDIVTMIAALTTGSMILMWLSELISEKGIGNGSSIIITVGILSSLPTLLINDFQFIQRDFAMLFNGNLNVLLSPSFILTIVTAISLLAMIYLITYVTEGTRKITIQYASRVRSTQVGQKNYLPLKINQAGVMPVIFASALLTFPQILAQLFVSIAKEGEFLYKVGNKILNSFLVNGTSGGDIKSFILYEIVFLLIIVFFTFFYTFVTYKPSETAENLKKGSGFIPGIRPGKETEKYIQTILIRLTFWGALFLGVIAIIPSLIRLIPAGVNLSIFSGIGGTSLLIIVGVINDTIRQIKSIGVVRSYEKFK